MNNDTYRIIKNSLFLFIRMSLGLIVSLYTVKILLVELGIEDYGIYSLIYGVVTGFSFVSISLSVASQRFISYDLGQKKNRKLNFTFSTINNIFIIFGVIVCILLMVLKNVILSNLNISYNKYYYSQLLYNYTIVIFLFTILLIPLNGLIISFEKMKFYSYVTIIDIFLKLVTIYALKLTSYNKMVFYGFLLMLISILNYLIYVLYIKKAIKNIKYYPLIVKSIFVKIFHFFKWNLIGSLTTVCNDQGVNIVLNIFFNPTVTGFRAISNRLVNVIGQISSTIFIAVTPQIVKSYAANDFDYTKKLLFWSTKISIYLILLICFPLYFNIEIILKLWLNQTSLEIINFCKLGIIFSILSCYENPLTQLMRANGNIRNYQISIGILTLLTLPISIFFFKLGYDSTTILIVMNVIYFLALFLRIHFVKGIINITFNEYINKILLKNIIIIFLVFIIYNYLIHIQSENIYIFNWISQVLVFFILYPFLVIFIGMSKEERLKISLIIRNKINVKL